MDASLPAFHNAFTRLMEHEGGLVHHPKDPGGLTKYGISQRTYPTLDIRNLTEEQARDIYYRDWWVPLRCPELPPAIAVKLFNMAVNIGKGPAIGILQKAINILKSNTPIAVDGQIGPATIAAANAIKDPYMLLETMRRHQLSHYKGLIAANPSLAVFERGWERRARA